MRIIATLFTSLALLSGVAEARPVSYPDAWTVMLRNDADQNSAHVHYTIDTQHSVGLRLRYDREGDFVFTGAQLNRLIKRWNEVDSQANLYGRVAIGQVSDNLDSGELRLKRDRDEALFFGVSGDWETRRYMVEGHHRPESRDKVGASALLRFFKGPSLLEVGVDDQGEPLLNYIHRF